MEPAYRSAKLLREQLKAGASLDEFNRLRGNFAAELGIVKDRMQAESRTKRLLQPYFDAYQSALDAYAVAGDTWKYRSAMDLCTGPEPGLEKQQSKVVPLDVKTHEFELEAAWVERNMTCLHNNEDSRRLLNQLAARLGTNCGTDIEWHLDCLFKFANDKLTVAEKLLTQH